jgi:3-(3-hydroxy-phenyl)propionate hydroxylase
LVNSGRLSVPAVLLNSELNSPDTDTFNARMSIGATAQDAPMTLPNGQSSWLLKHMGAGFTLMVFDAPFKLADLRELSYQCKVLHVVPNLSDAKTTSSNTIIDREDLIANRYDLRTGTAYLFRPDQHVCARWREVSIEKVLHAIQRSLAKE